MHQWEPYYSASMQESDEGSAPPPPNNGLEVGIEHSRLTTKLSDMGSRSGSGRGIASYSIS